MTTKRPAGTTPDNTALYATMVKDLTIALSGAFAARAAARSAEQIAETNRAIAELQARLGEARAAEARAQVETGGGDDDTPLLVAGAVGLYLLSRGGR